LPQNELLLFFEELASDMVLYLLYCLACEKMHRTATPLITLQISATATGQLPNSERHPRSLGGMQLCSFFLAARLVVLSLGAS
jgi:hypothetical protein